MLKITISALCSPLLSLENTTDQKSHRTGAKTFKIAICESPRNTEPSNATEICCFCFASNPVNTCVRAWNERKFFDR